MGRDTVSLMQTKMGDVLSGSEEYLGAQPLTIKGSRALATWADDEDMASILPNFLAQHGKVDELVVSDEAIPNAFVAAVTGDRVLVFSRSVTGKPKKLVEEYDLASTTLDFVDMGHRVRSLVFIFGMPSGKVFAGECLINGKALDEADTFVAA